MKLPPLYPHQERALARLEELDGRAGLFMEMGTGKTRVSLVHAAERGSRRVLVVCPMSASTVWRREVNKIGAPFYVANITAVNGTPKKAEALSHLGDGSLATVTPESYWRKPLRDAILKWKPDAVIFDEAQRIKHRGTHQSRFSRVLGDRSIPIKLALTGTPIANGLQDIWSIYRFVDKNVFGSWADFEKTFLVLGGFGGFSITGYQNVETAHRLIDSRSFQCSKDELNLPPRVDVPIVVPLSSRTRAVYDELKKQAIVMLMNADGQPTSAVARIALTMLLRLHQVAGGFVRDVADEIIDLSDEKVLTTLDLIEDALAEKQRVVVFTRFRHDLDKLQGALTNAKIPFMRMDGSTPPKMRDFIQEEHLAGRVPVLLLQIRTGSVSIDLTQANVAVFYSTGFSLDDFLQARDRLHRSGQHRSVTYYHLIAERTVDGYIYAALRNKVAIARAVTSLSYASQLFSSKMT